MNQNEEYRTAFEKAIVLLKAQQERLLSAQEHQQLNEHVALCRQHEKEN